MSNPLLQDWATPFGLPPFDLIEPSHFRPAFDAAIAEHAREIEAIARNPAPPDFANTIEAMELSGRLLDQVAGVFFNLAGAHTSDELQEVERWAAPALARHHSSISMNADLFARVEAVHRDIDAVADPEARRVLELYHDGFVRAGARLEGADRDRMAEIMQRLAELGAAFSQNVLNDEKYWFLKLEGPEALAGLPDFVVGAAAQAAADRGETGHVVTLSRSLITPFLQFSENRELRERAWRAWTTRGEMRGETDNRPLVAETAALRAERARLLGYPNFAAYKLADQMARTPERVREMLMAVWAPARRRALEERDAMQALAAADGASIRIQPWDWRRYAEMQRKAEHDIDEAEIKPYLPLDRMIEAAFDCAGRLFGLEFRELPDAPRHHTDARVWEATRNGAHVAVFIGDYFARGSKRSGAWMSAYRGQRRLGGEVRPIICNTMNFAKSAPGEAALLTWEDARTLFHEFGHALHGMLSDVTYPRVAGTSVARDFVELPSQLYEHWLGEPDVLRRFARHHRTGQPMPESLIERIRKAENFGQGFASVEYVASALVDLETHLLEDATDFDPMAFEAEILGRLDMPEEIVMRHRTPHFAHVFSGDGYSAGYYSYMWSEVMDADAFAAFQETGDVFDAETARRLAETVYAAGGRQAPEDAYIAFRGRLPAIDALLKQRGLAA